MALTNPKIFGLKITNKLTDVEDSEKVLENLRLELPDLDVIRGSVNAGASREDFINFSRLSRPIFKTLDRFYEDIKSYEAVVLDRASISSILFGNLTINGRLDGTSVRYRYRYLDPDDSSALPEYRLADISTSRVSSWSSSDTRASSSDLSIQEKARISYGGQVQIVTNTNTEGGSDPLNKAHLVFGDHPTPDVTGISGKPRLQTSLVPQEKEFDAERPTHTVTVDLDGTPVQMYAMKGIPLIFEGTFRNLINARIRIVPESDSSTGDLIKPSWKIVEVDNPNAFLNFENVLNSNNRDSYLTFKSSSSKNRFIQFYYRPDKIQYIIIRSANIQTLPVAILDDLRLINLENNAITNMPDLKTFGPKVTNLNLRRNPLNNSEDPNERRLNTSVLAKMPDNVNRLYLGSTFYGSINDGTTASASLIYTRFSGTDGLEYLVLQRYGGLQYFHKDSADPECHIPNVSDNMKYYNIYRNDFRGIAGGSPIAQLSNSNANTSGSNNGRTFLSAPSGNEKTIKTCANLENLLISRNYNLTDESFSIASAAIKDVRMTFTNLPMPDLQNKSALTRFEANHCRNLGHMAYKNSSGNEIYKLNNCSALTQIYISNATSVSTGTGASPNGALHGPLPTTFTNINLEVLRLENTRLQGGIFSNQPEEDETFSGDVIPGTLFDGYGTKLRDFRISSNKFHVGGVGNNVFNYTPNLQILRIRSNKKINGTLPNIGGCPKLRYLDYYNNAFTGDVYQLSSNESLTHVYLHVNQLSGTIPEYKNLPNLQRLRLNQNNFTGLSKFTLPKLIEFRAHINDITGTIPTFSDCPKLKFLTLFNNDFTGYTPGAISQNYQLRLADFSQCRLGQNALDTIIDDLYENYEASGSSRSVTLNVQNQKGSDDEDISFKTEQQEKINTMRDSGWTIIF